MLPAKPFRDYAAEEALELAAQCTWPSRKYLLQEFEANCRDWLKETKKPLTKRIFTELTDLIINAACSEIWFYLYEGTEAQFAIMADIRIKGWGLKSVALIVDPAKGCFIGLWKIKKQGYLRSRPSSWRIR